MNFYKQKQKWKYLLLFVATITIISSIFFTNKLIYSLGDSTKILSNSANSLKNSTDSLETSIRNLDTIISEKALIETKKVEKWAKATNLVTNYWDINNDGTDEEKRERSLAIETIKNVNIPLILVDECNDILQKRNVEIPEDMVSLEDQDQYLKIQIELMKKQNEPVLIILPENNEKIIDTQKVYYKGSKSLEETKEMKINLQKMSSDNQSLSKQSETMHTQSQETLKKLRYYSLLQISFILLCVFFAYLIFNASRRSERNLIWAGMAKETAHQIGTPLSSLMAWLELLKQNPENESMTIEMDKDLKRLETITERFSKIGSKPKLNDENITEIIENSVSYMEKRFSKNIQFIQNISIESKKVKLNRVLLIWVIENICKNAADAMKGEGKITINCSENDEEIQMYISDTGTGIDKSIIKSIFMPGITSKNRGWGLGLSLSKRIIEDYHKGKLFVQNSNEEDGTTFCISLPKS